MAGKVAALDEAVALVVAAFGVVSTVNNYDPPTAQVTGAAERTEPGTVNRAAERLAEALDRGRLDVGAQWWQATRIGVSTGEHEGSQHGSAMLVALASALCDARRWHDEAMHAGWCFGLLAHTRRVPLDFVLEDLDLLISIVLARASEPVATAGGGDALSLARRIHDAANLLRLAAVKGYMQSVSDDLKRHYRTLRHDLRNPLGTIRSALALMEDETMPAEIRANPRFRALARKNAASMEAMIRTTLGDSASQLPAFAHEPVSLRALAAAVRRDLRPAAEARQVRIVVGDRLPTVQTDSAGFELVLRSVVLAVMRDLTSVDIVIELAHVAERCATIQVSVAPDSADCTELDPADLAFARAIAMGSGGQVSATGPRRQVCVEVPISAERE